MRFETKLRDRARLMDLRQEVRVVSEANGLAICECEDHSPLSTLYQLSEVFEQPIDFSRHKTDADPTEL
ncbi:hypothetical protein SLA2020_438110 [Shorea laevis]